MQDSHKLPSYQFKYPKFFDCGKFKYDKLLTDIFGDRSESTMKKFSGCLSHLSEEFEFTGMNPQCVQVNNKKSKASEFEYFEFDSNFESGNLDAAIKVSLP
jgi:hypothetical protein